MNRLVTVPDITNALAALRPTLDQYRELGAKVTSRVDPLADSVTNTLAEANRALAQIRGAGENLRPCSRPIRRCATTSTWPWNSSPAPRSPCPRSLTS